MAFLAPVLPGLVGAGLVGTKAAVQLGAGDGGYKTFLNQMQADYTDQAVNTPSITLPQTPDISSAINMITQSAFSNAPLSAADQLRTRNGQQTSTQYMSPSASMGYVSDTFTSSIQNSLGSLLSSNSLMGDDPNYGKKFGSDISPLEIANYQDQSIYTSGVATGANRDVMDVRNYIDISKLDVNQIAELGKREDLNSKLFFTNETLSEDKIAAIQKNILKAHPDNSWGFGDSAAVDHNAITEMQKRYNTFNQSLQNRSQNKNAYITFTSGGADIGGFNVAGSGLKRLQPSIQQTVQELSSQAETLSTNIQSITTNQQTLVQEQMSAAELERKNAETAIYNQLARSRKRRGY